MTWLASRLAQERSSPSDALRVLIFTCARDAGLARLATKTIPRGWSVAWVVDGTDAGIKVPGGVELIVAPFKRGSVLNGPGACLGIASTLCREADRFGRVAKVDSDCLLVRPDQLAHGGLAGMPRAKPNGAVYGLAYALDRTAAKAALSGILGAIADGSRLGGEDEEVTSRAGTTDGAWPKGSMWQSWHNGKLPPAECYAIHCGLPSKRHLGPGFVEKEMVRLGSALGLWKR